MAQITEEYLFHIKELNDFNLDQASEFMVLASELIEIKARLLLPNNSNEEKEEEENDLVQRLEEYELFKKVSVELELYLDKAAKSFRLPEKEELTQGEAKLNLDISPEELKDMFLIALKSDEEKMEDPHYSEMDNINPDRLSVEDKRKDINKIIENNPHGVKFEDLLYNKEDILDVVVTLLSLLELMRLREVEVYQDNLFSEMKIMNRKQVV